MPASSRSRERAPSAATRRSRLGSGSVGALGHGMTSGPEHRSGATPTGCKPTPAARQACQQRRRERPALDHMGDGFAGSTAPSKVRKVRSHRVGRAAVGYDHVESWAPPASTPSEAPSAWSMRRDRRRERKGAPGPARSAPERREQNHWPRPRRRAPASGPAPATARAAAARDGDPPAARSTAALSGSSGMPLCAPAGRRCHPASRRLHICDSSPAGRTPPRRIRPPILQRSGAAPAPGEDDRSWRRLRRTPPPSAASGSLSFAAL